MFNYALAAASAFTFATVAIAPASSQSVADFYKGNRITIIVGSDVGGGYDVNGRLVGRHLGRHIPGQPSVIVQNMPSVASVVATNHIVNVAPKDGTVIGAVQREIAMVEILGQPGPKFKATELNWLGSLVSEPGVCGVATRTGIQSFADVFKREYIMGSSGPNVLEHYPTLFNKLLGAKFKIVRGYKSSTEISLAVERGEMEGVCQSWASFKENYARGLRDGTILPLVQVALKPHPEMQKLGIPVFSDFVTAERVQTGYTVEDVTDYFNLQLATTVMGRPYVMAPNVPADRVSAMRRAFEDMTRDPAFLDDADKLRRDIDLVTGPEIAAIVDKMARVPKEKIDKLGDILKTQ